MTSTITAQTGLVRTVPELNQFLARTFPELDSAAFGVVIEAEPGRVRMALDAKDAHLRPGGLISGPTLMTLADIAAYALIAAHVREAEMALTTALSIHFLRRSTAGRVLAEASLLKLGRRTALTDVRLSVEGVPELAAHATAHYALPASSASA